MQWQMADSLGLPLASLLAGQQGWGSLQGQRPAPSDQLQEQEPGRRLEWLLELRLELSLGLCLNPELLLLQQKQMGCFLGLGAGIQREALTVGPVWVQTLYVSVWRALVLGLGLSLELESELAEESAERRLVEKGLL